MTEIIFHIFLFNILMRAIEYHIALISIEGQIKQFLDMSHHVAHHENPSMVCNI